MPIRKFGSKNAAESKTRCNCFSFVLMGFLFSDSDMYLALYRKSLKSKEMDHDGTHFDGNYPHIFVVLGASVSQINFKFKI